MNAWDRDNLNFLLNASKQDMEEWYHYATQDDLDYALQIVRQGRTELEMQELELLDGEVNEMDQDEMTESHTVLSKFTLQ